MRNYILGLLSGIAGAWLCSVSPGWMVWILFLVSIGLIALGLDVFFGSREENQPKAARMGLVLFGFPGVFLQALVWILAA
jgi:hypothetical protein